MHCIEGSLYDEAVASLPDTQRLIIMVRGAPLTSQKVIQELMGPDRGGSIYLKIFPHPCSYLPENTSGTRQQQSILDSSLEFQLNLRRENIGQ